MVTNTGRRAQLRGGVPRKTLFVAMTVGLPSFLGVSMHLGRYL